MNCQAVIEAAFSFYLLIAQQKYGGIRPTLTVAPLPEAAHGLTQHRRKSDDVTIDPRVCERSQTYVEFVVIHELGHVIDFGISSKYLTDEMRERNADKYGSTLWTKNETFLAEVTPKCAEGSTWACEKLEHWRNK